MIGLSPVRHKPDTRWKIIVGAVVLVRVNQVPDAKSLDKIIDEALTEDRPADFIEK